MVTFKMNCLPAIILAALIPVSCAVNSGAEPTPTPTPYDVNRLYGYFENLKENNVAILREMEHDLRVSFRGTIDRVEEREIRFYVEPPKVLAEDKYVECNFRSNADRVSLYKEADVTVQARLVRALRGRIFVIGERGGVVFEDCELVEIHQSQVSSCVTVDQGWLSQPCH